MGYRRTVVVVGWQGEAREAKAEIVDQDVSDLELDIMILTFTVGPRNGIIEYADLGMLRI